METNITSDAAAEAAIRHQAAKWLIELETAEGGPGPDLWRFFQRWLANPAHRAAYLRIERQWHLLGTAILCSPFAGEIAEEILHDSR